ncbi:uncharacterized protein LOC125768818 isoform X4 [Anopheles funestus]|uniref:uncharacterized protein LOC125768818 isoform X4 n=1 Tax=Anopheles funestus TaxID=62324 RepID=UPI0020C6F96F|nr:uncharacterized protein LOC125768818 isoform X4 [Anopheles funestus]
MEHSLNQRDGINPSPTSIGATSTIKQEPFDEEMQELKIEILHDASSWECSIKADPLKEEIEIDETDLTVQDPFFMIEEIGINAESNAAQNEEIEDHVVVSRCASTRAIAQADTLEPVRLVDMPLADVDAGARKSAHETSISCTDPICCKAMDRLRQAELKVQQLEKEKNLYLKSIHLKLDFLIKHTTAQRLELEKYLKVKRPKKELIPRSDFALTLLENEQQLERFDRALQTNPKFNQKVQQYLQRRIHREDVQNRLHQTLDLLFSKSFFAQINWTGISRTEQRKVQLNKFKNVLQLFITVGANETGMPTEKYVVDFLKKKLKHAKERIHIPETRTTSSHKKVRIT